MAGVRARRYARAIFDLAEAEKDLETWATRIQDVKTLFEQPDLHELLADPSTPPSQRVQLVETLTGESLDEEALNLARLLAANGATGLASDIGDAYRDLVDQAQGRVRATAVTAVELTQKDRERIARELSEKLGREVELEARVDPKVIGGVLLEIGDRVIDGTVAGRLQQLRRTLVSA